jgi:uncharacterized membrane protein YtjA (UPF0391 family)
VRYRIKGLAMLYYAVVFFAITVVAAILGFGGIAAGAAGIAKVLFFIYLTVAIATLILGTRTNLGRRHRI